MRTRVERNRIRYVLVCLIVFFTLSPKHAAAQQWAARAGGGQTPAPVTAAVPVTQIINDPIGDHITSSGLPIVDIGAVSAGSDGVSLTIRVAFSSNTVMTQVVGLIDLDTDQNKNTGISPAANGFIPGTTQDIGVDYFLDLFSIPNVNVIRTSTLALVGSVTRTVSGQTIEMTIPLSMLGSDDGNINVGMVLGNLTQPTDAAPNTGHGIITPSGVLACNATLNKTTFVNNDQVIAQTLQVDNPGASPVNVEYKLWFDAPGMPPASFLRGGADGSFTLAAGFSQNFGPMNLFIVTSSLPRGAYSFNCRFLDPVTGAIKAEDLNPFTVQ